MIPSNVCMPAAVVVTRVTGERRSTRGSGVALIEVQSTMSMSQSDEHSVVEHSGDSWVVKTIMRRRSSTTSKAHAGAVLMSAITSGGRVAMARVMGSASTAPAWAIQPPRFSMRPSARTT